MKVKVTVVERITKDVNVDIPDSVQDIIAYCNEIYNNGDLDDKLENNDFTSESITIEKLQ